ncbi:gag-pol polyprotein [Cucumis melo var. makuwa]|uniref:Gag-pol polyprotein n=1 Tax=Cucumis melo var. makuwa TaxID=1194695 RepID=A0A5A7SLA0_CUCMM|nr:gag-pol polyprotein [Cucumis melo var. makuwa]
MEIIREGLSASRPPVLDGKNYSYWKPRMIFFIKTLDGKAWRALVSGYNPPMITVNGVSIPKPEVDWTDAEEQASVGNARELNTIFNGVDLNVYKKFDMKVTAIEEAHDITTLKLDELFGSLLTFEMATADRESKKGKGIAFKSTHDTNDNEEDNGMNAFTVHITKSDSNDESESSEENYDNEMTFEQLKVLWEEDTEARAIQKERIQDLMEENERLMSVISSLKLKLKEVQKDYDQMIKFVKMLNSGTENLDLILNSGQTSSSKYGLGFDASERSIKPTTETKFIPTLVKDETETVPTMTVVNPPAKTTRWTCYYCGK